MRSQRPRPRAGGRFAPGLAVVATLVAVSGCSALGVDDRADSGPPRLSPNPVPEVVTEMVEGRSAPGTPLNACALLDLTVEEIIDLTDADMPEVEPTGSGDLGLLCTYGGPGSLERYELQQAEAEAAAAEAEEAEAASTAPETTATTTTTTSTPSSTTTPAVDPDYDPDYVPDSVAAGAVKPRGGAPAALAGQATMLGVRYACSEVRGEDASAVANAAPGAPGAPAAVEPDLDTAYIDCVTAPAGGGIEVHTILVADNDLWHITLISPQTPRTPEAEARALEGLHRVAEKILD